MHFHKNIDQRVTNLRGTWKQHSPSREMMQSLYRLLVASCFINFFINVHQLVCQTLSNMNAMRQITGRTDVTMSNCSMEDKVQKRPTLHRCPKKFCWVTMLLFATSICLYICFIPADKVLISAVNLSYLSFKSFIVTFSALPISIPLTWSLQMEHCAQKLVCHTMHGQN